MVEITLNNSVPEKNNSFSHRNTLRLWVKALKEKGNFVEAIRKRLIATGESEISFRLGSMRLIATADLDQIRKILIQQPERYEKLHYEAKVLGSVIGDGLILAQGEDWAKHRQAMQPAFGPEQMPYLIKITRDATLRRVLHWKEIVNGSREASCIGNDVITRFFMGGDPLGSLPGEESLESYAHYFSDLEQSLEARASDPLGIKITLKKLFKQDRSFERAILAMDQMILNRVSKGKQTPKGDDSPLALLLNQLPSHQQLIRELKTMVAAGATTTHHLAWTFQLLANHPEVQERLWEELDRGPLEEEDESIGSMGKGESYPYLQATINESLRLYPPAPLMFRRDQESGIVYLIPIWAIQRHPELWEDSEIFRPERWLDETAQGIKSSKAFLPFGLGPRACIGRVFALIESRIVLSEILRRYRLKPALSKTPDPVVLIMTRPKEEIRFRVEAR